MKVAEVIVDVPARQTDRPFDYAIPEKWEDILQPGMRVTVPFGTRRLQGFVIHIKSHSDVKTLKPIEAVLDVTPVLNEELLELGKYLTETTLCFAISAYQAMLPAALKAKYEKEIRLVREENRALLPETIQPLFQDRSTVDWKEVEHSDWLRPLQKAIQQGYLEVVYHVKEKAAAKTVKYVELAQSHEEVGRAIDALPANAAKQRQLLTALLSANEAVPLRSLLEQTGATYASLKSLVAKGLVAEKEIEVYRDPYGDRSFPTTAPLSLTAEQEKALSSVIESVRTNKHEVFLLYGVTGSGKTEVYMQAIEEVLRQGKEAIVLVPEISLTPQMVKRFKGRFGSQVAVLHSGLSIGEKYDEWRKIHRKEVQLVVGARSAIFAPFENLGMIIIDEEHETSYKQEENPRYHARDVAIYRARVHGCPVVLGSATPSLESFARAKKGVYQLLTLQKRVSDNGMPDVHIVDMREELRSGNRSMFSRALFEKLKDRLHKGEQSVLFLNRRGYSTFVMCRGCGYVIRCPHCDISLTYHRAGQRLKCHYCGYEEPITYHCPSCGNEHIRFFGTGTQKVEEELTKLLPEARVIRMDVDTTSRKGAHERLLAEFGEGKADILLGTQMIAKGLDFPKVTLVGVLAADTTLHLPDFRASEKTFQLLTQVSGRAGRHALPGEVVIQTYTPEHYSIALAAKHDYDAFYQREMVLRKMHGYPPFYYLTLITVSHPEITKAVAVTDKIASYLRAQLSNEAIILGPVASPIARLHDRYRYQCMIKYKREPNMTRALKAVIDRYQHDVSQGDLSITIDTNPYTMM
ncbi:primosomal protein N' [Parageobacillus thermoglucosidasius]|uniref:primosomal protein N' n=1 Tax=Parageobacillus thermoglucosidasius TaxID=1426 RepID=UPI0001D1706F|nr:primosomal protein N' [Parageobacillus thermoglucosidasius]AEH48638.1 primosomal protein N' [Parageobacillus thermoglucosidasius C56-YS93]MED4904422.1 primosomal protein N' [Parageobacillus thermoglucosidasius]MED4912318.1 primosomal protein N' [Parageobacillus thermoglucosidasius]MED4943430.1 primosomal protein N' [Parageobacillus thermoglucosidasius]MED4983258.1 primosomal protein N' [Parageobacillus thermoglucosidasius]